MLLPYRIETESEKLSLLTYIIIGANAAIFLSMRFLPASMLEMAYYDYGFIPERIHLFTMFSSMFIHVGWLHIVGNMYFLWLFGRALEGRMNGGLFVALYFGSGIAGGLLQAWLTPDYLTDVPCIGASGAISGVLGAYMIMHPREEVDCIYFSFAMRYATSISLASVWVLGSWFFLQFANALWLSPKTAEGMVAFWAHIGGFASAAVAAALFKYSAALARTIRRRSGTVALEEYSDLIHKGRVDEAATRLSLAVKASPSDALVLAECGKLELTRGNRSGARKLLRRSLKNALDQKNDAKAISAYLALTTAGENPPDNSRRLIMGRRFARLKKYGHALGIMSEAFDEKSGARSPAPDSSGRRSGKKSVLEMEGLDKLLYEIAEILGGPLKDQARAAAAYGILKELFPHSPRSLDAEYQLRKLRAFKKV
ncbi:rhomboid family intramembrane serine protease [Candidatus Poribacteria bacterium]|nr:rhomboid family intramembrane serine protease [Candidatus Poribacteria bacterium]